MREREWESVRVEGKLIASDSGRKSVTKLFTRFISSVRWCLPDASLSFRKPRVSKVRVAWLKFSSFCSRKSGLPEGRRSSVDDSLGCVPGIRKETHGPQ